MRTYHNIEKSGFRFGEYVGYDAKGIATLSRKTARGYAVYREKGESYVKLPGMTWKDCKLERIPLGGGINFGRDDHVRADKAAL